jgi:hypothetical protein
MTRLAKLLCSISVLVAGCDLAGQTVGPRGGTVVSEDGRFSVEIAPGALEEMVEITIEERACAAIDVDAIGPCYEVGPRGTAFLFPARVVVELDGGDIAGATGERLALSTERDAKWRLLADRDFDLEDGTLSASAAYLSSFAVVAMSDEHKPGPATRDAD